MTLELEANKDNADSQGFLECLDHLVHQDPRATEVTEETLAYQELVLKDLQDQSGIPDQWDHKALVFLDLREIEENLAEQANVVYLEDLALWDHQAIVSSVMP